MTVLCMTKQLKHFYQRSRVILNIASVGGTNGGRAGVAYTALQHAVVGLTKNTAYMYQNDGIRVNAIAPVELRLTLSWPERTLITWFWTSISGMGASLEPNAECNMALFLVSDATRKWCRYCWWWLTRILMDQWMKRRYFTVHNRLFSIICITIISNTELKEEWSLWIKIHNWILPKLRWLKTWTQLHNNEVAGIVWRR